MAFPQQYRSQFNQASSIRARIINDDETTSTLLEMVEISHKIVTRNAKYPALRNLLAEVVLQTPNLNEELRTVRKAELFSGVQCGGISDVDVDVGIDIDIDIDADHVHSHANRHTNTNMHANTNTNTPEMKQYESTKSFTTNAEARTMNRILDSYIIEILRFLAMKILLEAIPSSDSDPHMSTRALTDGHDNDSNDGDGGYEYRYEYRTPIKSPTNILPSKVLRGGWKALLHLPFLYSDVCMAMGCDGPLDMDAETQDIVHTQYLLYSGEGDAVKDSAVKTSRENYRYTLDTYERVYLVVPEGRFWLRLTFECDGDEERDSYSSVCDGVSDVLEWMVVKVKESVNGREDTDRMPDSVQFEKDLYLI